MKNSTKLYLIFLLSVVVAFLLWEKLTREEVDYNSKFLSYLDSMNQRNELLFRKVDSLQKERVSLYKEYTKVKLKYDTIQIAIDTMPDLEGTKFLLSISRQLTAKGIE